MNYQEYLSYDGLGLAELVAKKEIHASELLNIALERSNQVNPELNAIVIPMHDYALKRTEANLSGPFAGVPFLVKDLFQEYAGYPTSYGCTGFKRIGYIPDTNAEIVNRWEKSGIVTFGRTNTPEFGIKGITEPDAWGSCKNPWNLAHNSGGSSGGSASAVAGGIVPIAGAGDGGGSIRIPASYCGLFGLKPSRGRTPWGPQMSEAMHGAAIQHVLTKTVRDSAAMLDATHGEDHHSMFKIEQPHTHYLEIIQQPPKKLKIAFNTKSPIGTKISKDAVQAINQTVKLLESLGHEVIEDHPAIDGMQLAKDFITTWFSQFSYMLEEIRRQYPSKSTDFIAQIGGKLRSGISHGNRAPDYDDWTLNGDLIYWNDVLECAFEISSMGIRVDPAAMDRQLSIAGCDHRRSLPFHKMLLDNELPLTVGGGIGQSRLCMLLIGCAHIGEVQSGLWDEDTMRICSENNIPLL